ncbi:DUF1353 domain-containing protein [Aeromonas caviae]|uniref:DUF1353 domain-containing protein n=1 Tax=Aeromonas TaxID=642 RepID=UPI000F777925|nr:MULTISPECIES: DUF1353 domain-containing protein [Aeromonas]MBS4707336.1 DUF1353 domain-containing protein [Aeromonas caviae]RSM32270.1 hypothetical protein C5B78_00890 [Aeromonas salmonicida]
MNNIYTQPILQPVDDLNWELHEEYYVLSEHMSFTIPKGFKTDLASVPKAIWNIYPPFGLYTGAAVAHDYLYRTKQMRVTRKEADALFKEQMLLAGVDGAQAQLMYLVVRAFGWSAFVDR